MPSPHLTLTPGGLGMGLCAYTCLSCSHRSQAPPLLPLAAHPFPVFSLSLLSSAGRGRSRPAGGSVDSPCFRSPAWTLSEASLSWLSLPPVAQLWTVLALLLPIWLFLWPGSGDPAPAFSGPRVHSARARTPGLGPLSFILLDPWEPSQAEWSQILTPAS